MNMIIDILISFLFSALIIAFSVCIASLLNLVILNSWHIYGKKPTYWDAIKKTIKELTEPYRIIFKSIKTKDKSADVFANVIFVIMMTLAMFVTFMSVYGQVHLH